MGHEYASAKSLTTSQASNRFDTKTTAEIKADTIRAIREGVEKMSWDESGKEDSLLMVSDFIALLDSIEKDNT
jgi:hypothetical protein